MFVCSPRQSSVLAIAIVAVGVTFELRKKREVFECVESTKAFTNNTEKNKSNQVKNVKRNSLGIFFFINFKLFSTSKVQTLMYKDSLLKKRFFFF